ncbi:hypothetical protein MS3_00008480 [Schistosoma haematobium]|uniref:Stathmin n=1 Tax=Schistosoma haematobium TaxID=6185 RepID=A0A922IK70_SCHHA|nr:hypothetical protein MS3_00008480 [Schistosoma haematobium]KAH9581300.1 hypothetical protein MS3_00008480 [Schistosoma haematobium]CAH8622529.1 unnamed protein product [Schistosoma haematobium]
MGTNNLNCSVSFEIPIRDEIQSPRALRLLSSPNYVRNDSDLNERLEKARERRSNVLAETINRNEQHVHLAKSKCEQEKEKLVNRSNELMENLTEDLAQKSSRRQQIIDKIVNRNKKEIEKAKQLADARASPQSILLRQINDDMSNKENNRRSHLQNIVHQCQLEPCHFLSGFRILGILR